MTLSVRDPFPAPVRPFGQSARDPTPEVDLPGRDCQARPHRRRAPRPSTPALRWQSMLTLTLTPTPHHPSDG